METVNEGKIKLVADVALCCGDEVLLIKYTDNNKYDHQKGWFLPDDLINDGEHPEDAVFRILKEQIGLDVKELELGFIESFTGNDKSWHLVFHYKKNLYNKPALKQSADISEMEWFDTNKLPEDKDIAHHGWAKYTISAFGK